LEIPSDIQVVLKNGATAIADVARIIVDSLPDDDNATITIGFYSERNVSFHLAPSNKGKQKEQAGTAVVTLELVARYVFRIKTGSRTRSVP
jgi:hypothetical protein